MLINKFDQCIRIGCNSEGLLRYSFLFALATALFSCSSIDNNATDDALGKHYDYAKWNSAQERWRDKYDGMTPYNYYRNQGYSPERAQHRTDADGGFFDPSNFPASNTGSY